MNAKTFAILALALSPALAQGRFSAALVMDQQHMKSRTMAADLYELELAPGLLMQHLDPEKNKSYGLQFGYTGWTFGSSDLTLTASHRFKGKSNTSASVMVVDYYMGEAGLFYGKGKIELSYTALGAVYSTRKPMELGVGLQLRMERLRETIEGSSEHISARMTRPWLTTHAGYTIKKVGSVNPFALVQLAVPLARKGQVNIADYESADYEKNILKSMAGKFELSLHAGIRF